MKFIQIIIIHVYFITFIIKNGSNTNIITNEKTFNKKEDCKSTLKHIMIIDLLPKSRFFRITKKIYD